LRVATVLRGVWLVWLTLLFSGPLQAEIYRCPDGSFQNRPCVGEAAGKATATIADVDQGKHFIWQATAGKGTLYLLGSIHFGTQEMYPLPSVITSSFAQSDALVVEANILETDQVQLSQLLAEKAIYRDGSTLKQHLSAATWRRLAEVAASMNLPVEQINQQKPWFVSITLSALALNRFGYSEELGIDRHFLSKAQGQKKIVELESVAWQLSLFDKLTPEEQVVMLEETLRELGDGKAYFERLFRAWKRGDANDVQALFDEGVTKEPRSERVNQLMIVDRNKTMTAVLEKLASQGGRYFVVVGAGHLTGETGIIELLKAHGYQVMQY